jgi:predicted enzyme related to lactoylglutathione lyase
MAKLRHVAIRCDDLEWGAKFYSEVFEMEEVGRAGDLDSMGAIYLCDGVMNIALIKVTPDFPNALPYGLNHIGFVVKDVNEAIARAESHGAVSMMGDLKDQDKEKSGTWEMKMKAPDGVAFDLTEHGWPGNTMLYEE